MRYKYHPLLKYLCYTTLLYLCVCNCKYLRSEHCFDIIVYSLFLCVLLDVVFIENQGNIFDMDYLKLNNKKEIPTKESSAKDKDNTQKKECKKNINIHNNDMYNNDDSLF